MEQNLDPSVTYTVNLKVPIQVVSKVKVVWSPTEVFVKQPMT
jgi:hypothetical protein